MRVLLVGATGYVGGAAAEKLVQAGHEVLGLARSEEAASKLKARGFGVRRGDLTEPDALEAAARGADGVAYCAGGDPGAIAAIVGAMEGSGRPFAYLIGALLYGDTGEEPAAEDRPLAPPPPLSGLVASERAVLDASERGVRSSSVRAALVYGRGGGAIPLALLEDARRAGAGRYVGTGENRWAAVHVDDLGALLARALEDAPAGTPFNAVAENVSMREVAESVGRAVGAGAGPSGISPEEAREAWGFFGDPLASDLRLSGQRAGKLLGWRPSAPSVFEELELGSYREGRREGNREETRAEDAR